MEVRAARRSELAAVGALTLEAYRREGHGTESYRATLADAAGRARAACLLVAVIDATLAGTITLVPPASPLREIGTDDEDELRMLAVAPGHRRTGVGAALVLACQGSRWRAPGRRLVASSATTMHAAHRLYERLGFVRNPSRDWAPNPETQLIVFEWPGAWP